MQEFAEAAMYLNFMKHSKIPTHIELKITATSYIFGICDLTGELVRKAVYLAGKGESKKVETIKNFVDQTYWELLNFNFRDNEIRRKQDAIKYNLKKLEDLVLQLKLKDM